MKDNIFGKIAVDYAKQLISNKNLPSAEGWEEIAIKYLKSLSMAEKSCPKNTFLSLCEEGLIKGIPKGKYTKSKKNKLYALEAVKILIEDDTIKNNPLLLWSKIPNSPETYNQQMDVVCALWNENIIKKHNNVFKRTFV